MPSTIEEYSMKKCTSCKKEKSEEEFIKEEHKTCSKCIERYNRWERRHQKAYFPNNRRIT